MASDSLHIAFVASEMTPFMKTGGLADVVGALPKALAALGHRVSVFLPRYGAIPYPAGDPIGVADVHLGGVWRGVGYFERVVSDGVRVIFVEHGPLYDRPSHSPYGDVFGEFGDNRLRFALLAAAALEFFRGRGERPDAFHAHDWHAGLVPVYLKSVYVLDHTLYRMPSVFTIHNFAYQGLFGADTVDALGLPWHLAGGEGGLEFGGAISFMKGGLLFAEELTTVSPQYAREIQGPEMGHGMEGTVRARAADLTGILNGVDYGDWDPRHDPRIARTYSPEDLSGKAACKADLLATFGLPAEPDLPVVGVISRLVHQKGFDIVVEAWYDLLQRPIRMIVLGTGEPAVQDGFRALAARAPDRFAVRFAYDERLAHKIIAGADMFLMPSRFEPCGLTQMYSLRYGTVPIVRSTGGLVDTVEIWDPVAGTGTGFRFDHADGTALVWALDQALAAHRDAGGWKRLMRNGMAKDFSWERSARAYEAVYHRAREKA
jgi:starch synthase